MIEISIKKNAGTFLGIIALLIGLATFESCKENQVVEVTIPTSDSLPNILLIIADDMGLDATPGYNIGTEKPIMPVLQDLGANGLTFDNLWANPICSPTRASILTGKYGVRTGVLSASPPNNAISLSETSIQSYLSENTTYKSAVIGKWHLSNNSNGGADNPNLMGIEYYAGLLAGQHQDYSDWSFTENGETSNVQEYSTTFFTDLAIDWLQQQQSPWFLWLAYTAPHTPFHLPPAELHSSDNLSGDAADIDANPRLYYFAMLETLDTEMGRLLSSIDRDNTVIIFIGDNGSPGQVAQAPYSRTHAKGSVYQGGINVPMIVSGAGVTRTGQREDALVNSTDLFATIADLAGTGLESIHDSNSFKNLLDGGQIEEREFIYSEVDENTTAWTIRNLKYKLIEFQDGTQELYDLETDPYEESDLISSGLSSEEQQAKTELENLAGDVRN